VVADLGHVAQRLRPRRKGQIPTRVVGDGAGVPQRIAVGADRRLAERVAEHPELLEPRHVADLPEERVDDGQARAPELLIAEVGDERKRPPPGVDDGALELATIGHPLLPLD